MNINGMTSEKVRRKDKIKIPTHPEKWEKGSGYEVASAGSSTEGTSTESGSSTGAVTGDVSTGSENDGVFDRIFNKRHKTSMALLLPFNTAKKRTAR